MSSSSANFKKQHDRFIVSCDIRLGANLGIGVLKVIEIGENVIDIFNYFQNFTSHNFLSQIIQNI